MAKREELEEQGDSREKSTRMGKKVLQTMKLVFTIFFLLSFSIKSKAQSELYKHIDGGRSETQITPDWFNSALRTYKLDKSYNKFYLVNNRFLNDWLEMFEIRGNYSGLGNTYCMFYDHINQTFFLIVT